MIKSSNPALSTHVFQSEARISSSESMTIQGTVNKSALLLLCVVGAASFTWGSISPATLMPLSLLSGIGGLVVALVTHFKKHLSLQGVFLFFI